MRIRRKRNNNDSSFSPNPLPSSLQPSRGWGELQAKSDATGNSPLEFTPTQKPVQAQNYTLGEVGDVYEQEADANAKQVVEHINSPETVQRNEEEGEDLQMKPQTLQRNTAEEEDVQMKSLHPYIQRAILRDRPNTSEIHAKPLNPLLQRVVSRDLAEPRLGRDRNSPEIQRNTAEEEDVQMKPMHRYLQRMAREKTAKAIQRNTAEEDDVQMKPMHRYLQRMAREKTAKAIQRNTAEEEDVQMKPLGRAIQRADGGENTLDREFESTLDSAKRTGGQSLKPDLQAKMGEAMGADFSGVKVHTDTTSDQLNQSIQAKAFTTGQDVFFKRGEYNPSSQGGQELIAHELTHVVQQNGSSVQRRVNTEQAATISQHGSQTRSEEQNLKPSFPSTPQKIAPSSHLNRKGILQRMSLRLGPQDDPIGRAQEVITQQDSNESLDNVFEGQTGYVSRFLESLIEYIQENVVYQDDPDEKGQEYPDIDPHDLLFKIFYFEKKVEHYVREEDAELYKDEVGHLKQICKRAIVAGGWRYARKERDILQKQWIEHPVNFTLPEGPKLELDLDEKDNSDDSTKLLEQLGDDETLYIIAHGQGDRIGGFTPEQLFDYLKELGLKSSYRGAINLTSCWSGAKEKSQPKKKLMGGRQRSQTVWESYNDGLTKVLQKNGWDSVHVVGYALPISPKPDFAPGFAHQGSYLEGVGGAGKKVKLALQALADSDWLDQNLTSKQKGLFENAKKKCDTSLDLFIAVNDICNDKGLEQQHLVSDFYDEQYEQDVHWETDKMVTKKSDQGIEVPIKKWWGTLEQVLDDLKVVLEPIIAILPDNSLPTDTNDKIQENDDIKDILNPGQDSDKNNLSFLNAVSSYVYEALWARKEFLSDFSDVFDSLIDEYQGRSQEREDELIEQRGSFDED